MNSEQNEVYYYSAKALAGLDGMPKTESGVIRSAKNKGYTYRKRQGRGGGKEYLQSCLPIKTQVFLIEQRAALKVQAKIQAYAKQLAKKQAVDAELPRSCLLLRFLGRLMRPVVIEAIRQEVSDER